MRIAVDEASLALHLAIALVADRVGVRVNRTRAAAGATSGDIVAQIVATAAATGLTRVWTWFDRGAAESASAGCAYAAIGTIGIVDAFDAGMQRHVACRLRTDTVARFVAADLASVFGKIAVATFR